MFSKVAVLQKILRLFPFSIFICVMVPPPLCMILFSSLLLFFHLLYNSLSLSLNFFLLLQYVLCLLASFQSPFLFLLCYSFCLLSATLLQSSFCVSFLLSATLSCSMLPLSIFLLLSSAFCAAVLLYFLLLCFYSFYAVSLQPAFFLLSSLICFLSSDLFFSNFSSAF